MKVLEHIDNMWVDKDSIIGVSIKEKNIHFICNYNNIQPLWKLDNIKKSNKLPREHLCN